MVAFNSGNLETIAKMCKATYPSKIITIAADNDLATEKKIGSNPDRKTAEQAAASIGAELCICPMDSDFNDLQQAQGIFAVQQALKKTRKVKDETWENQMYW